ncbi:MAG: hypothetical protein HY700_14470 [Gemmatimonadetes bacterium]|nr:hypothetical protein [Gemmatimonadota bacterium]
MPATTVLASSRVIIAVRVTAALCVAALGRAAPCAAQDPAGWASGHVSALPPLTGDEVDRVRLAQLLGRDSLDGILLRTTSTLDARLTPRGASAGWAVLLPQLGVVVNSATPWSLNDGALWAGRGHNELIRFGARARLGPVWAIAAPELVHSQNRSFRGPGQAGTQPTPPDRSSYSSPWHTIPWSADLPIRFGERSFSRLDAGQSSIGVSGSALSAGLATENLWWGPGIRNAIVMSNNAPGFPHFFLRSSRPIATAVGSLEGSWIVGGLSESPYFDNTAANDLRSLAGMALAWRPRWVPGLQLGFTRTVFAPAARWTDLPLRLFNVFAPVGQPNSRPLSDSTMTPGRDQLYSFFARWVFPRDGVEAYAEWSRTEGPASFRDLLTAPNHTLGYTLGLQWARPIVRDRAILRFQAEATYLEQSPTFRDRPEGSYYTSRAVIQGYTQRGQTIGASIGPGASSQWLAVDFLPEHWGVGLVGGRIRWENDALYALPGGGAESHCYHDVAVFAGVRGGYVGGMGRAEISILTGRRLNPFFGHYGYCTVADPLGSADVGSTTLELWLSPSR